MTGFVLDASVTMSWFLGDARPADRAYAELVLDAMKSTDTRVSVPMTWGLEIANVIVRAESRNVVAEAQSEAFLNMLSAAPIHTDDETFAKAFSEILHLARRFGLSSYDASYLELALRSGLPLATLDADLARAARRAGVKRLQI